jgi:superfamily II DNA or RNA helicase
MEHATVYEHAIAHLELLHESLPEKWMESNNEHRPKRLMTKRLMKQEPIDEADAMGLSSDDTHPIHDQRTSDKSYESKNHTIVKDCDLMLRDYQENAIHTLHEQDGINALHIPCRMGKTLIAGHVIRSKQPHLIVVMAPLKISVQNLRDAHRLPSFLPTYKSLLVDSDVEGTTDRNEILAFLHTEGPHVIYTTYESAVTVVATIPGIEEAYLLVDEVHNVSPPHCEFIKRFTQGLVMSATLPEELEEELSLNTIVRVPFSEGIRKKYLTDYTIWLPFLTKEEGKTSVVVDIPDTFQNDDQTTITQAMYLATVMLKTNARRCIVYLKSQEDCQRFMALASKVFEEYHGITIWTNKIDATVTSAERTKRLRDFQSDLDAPFYLLTSVRVLDEAVDIPKCDSVFVTSVGEHSSDIRMTQRAMRGSTVDPSNPSKHNQVILWATGWEQCVNSLELIRAADPEFHKKIRVAAMCDRQEMTRETMEAVEQQEREMHEYVVVSCISLWERNKMRWVAMYEKLGKAPSTMSKDLEEKRTGQWQNNIRNAKKNGTLSAMRIADLENHPGWEWHWKIEETWEEQKQNWVAHYTKLQRAPSETSKDQEERRAANWHGKQRKAYHKNKISDERRATLETLLGWEWGTKRERIYTWEDQKQNWIKQYTTLQKTPSPTSKEKDAKRAGVWQCGLRETYHKKTLSKERTAELEEIIGWKWRSEKKTERGVTDTWEQQKQNWVTQYTKLQRYPSPLSKDSEEKRAGAWQGKQRTAYNKGTLSEETITELEDISGWAWNSGWAWDSDTWEQKKLNWITLYNTLQRTPLPSSNENDEKKAGQWQQTQRVAKKNGKMPPERIMALEEIPGWTWSGR